MLSTTIALIAATLAAGAAPAAASTSTRAVGTSFGPITASYHADRDVYCLRSGWSNASAATGRPARAGDCRTAADWRRRGIAFAPVELDGAGAAQIAAR